MLVLGNPLTSLSVIKHRQLARQVWIFGKKMLGSSMDLKRSRHQVPGGMNLHLQLLGLYDGWERYRASLPRGNHRGSSFSRSLSRRAGRSRQNFEDFLISSSTWTRKQLSSTRFSKSASKPLDNHGPSLVRLTLGLKNTAYIYQIEVSRLISSTLEEEEEEEEIPPTG